jgi:hypothetical protein
MEELTLRLTFILILMGLLSGQAFADTQWKTQTFGSNCKQVDAGNPEIGDEGDWILYMCEAAGFPPLWQMYQEGVRINIGLGTKANTTITTSAVRGDWPIVWGGEKKVGKFVPDVAIVRFNFGAEAPYASSLSILKLLPDGTSCQVGSVEGGPHDNEKAKVLAIASRTKWFCQSQTQPLDVE